MSVLTSGFNKLATQLLDLAKIHAPTVTATIGYTAPYAVYVHEDLTKNHPVGEAKWLENAIHANQQNVIDMIYTKLTAGQTMTQACEETGWWLLQLANTMCPVDTGRLKASAYSDVTES